MFRDVIDFRTLITAPDFFFFVRVREVGAWPEAAGWHRAPGRPCRGLGQRLPAGQEPPGLAHPERPGPGGREGLGKRGS